jgi:hypothetical protein
MMSEDYEVICTYCGAECWLDEMKTKEKCWECHVLECRHIHVIRDYQGSTNDRARFSEYCCTCESYRDVFFYFDFDMEPRRGPWHNENVCGYAEKELNQ